MTNRPPDIDWSRLVGDLRAAGLKLREIADGSGLHIASVCDLEKGRTLRTRFDAGARLVELHRKTMQRLKRQAQRDAKRPDSTVASAG